MPYRVNKANKETGPRSDTKPFRACSHCLALSTISTCLHLPPFCGCFRFQVDSVFWYRFRYRFQVYLLALCFSCAVPSMDISRGRYLKARIAVDEFNFVLLITNYVSSHGATHIHIHTYPYPSHIVGLSNNFISQLRDASSWSL